MLNNILNKALQKAGEIAETAAEKASEIAETATEMAGNAGEMVESKFGANHPAFVKAHLLLLDPENVPEDVLSEIMGSDHVSFNDDAAVYTQNDDYLPLTSVFIQESLKTDNYMVIIDRN